MKFEAEEIAIIMSWGLRADTAGLCFSGCSRFPCNHFRECFISVNAYSGLTLSQTACEVWGPSSRFLLLSPSPWPFFTPASTRLCPVLGLEVSALYRKHSLVTPHPHLLPLLPLLTGERWTLDSGLQSDNAWLASCASSSHFSRQTPHRLGLVAVNGEFSLFFWGLWSIWVSLQVESPFSLPLG